MATRLASRISTDTIDWVADRVADTHDPVYRAVRQLGAPKSVEQDRLARQEWLDSLMELKGLDPEEYWS